MLILVFSVCRSVDATAYPGEGILLGKTTVTPYVEQEAAFDSNVFLSQEPSSDKLVGIRIGVIGARAVRGVSFNGEIWGFKTWHSVYSERDAVDIKESMSISATLFGKVGLSVNQGYSMSQIDEDFLTDLIGDAQHIESDISFDYQLTDRISAKVGYAASVGIYEDRALFDWLQSSPSLQLDYQMTEAFSLSLASAGSSTKSGGHGNLATVYSGQVGFRTKITGKTDAALMGGWQYQGDDTDILIPSMTAGLEWRATERVAVTLGWDTAIRPAIQYRENYVIVSGGEIGATLGVTDTVSLHLAGGFHQNRYEDDVAAGDGTMKKLVEDVVRGSIDVSYTVPLQFLSLFVRSEYQRKASTLDIAEYDQYLTSVGVRLQY